MGIVSEDKRNKFEWIISKIDSMVGVWNEKVTSKNKKKEMLANCCWSCS